MKILVIADPDTCLAFALAGISTRPVHSGTKVAGLLATLNHQTTGLVLITEDLAAQNRETIDRLLLESGKALILEIPAIKGPAAPQHKAAERILSLLRRQ